MTVDLGNLLEVLVQVTVVLAAMGAGIRWLKRWLIKTVVTPMKEAKKQLEPNGGLQETTRHLIEQTSLQVSAMEITLGDMGKIDNENSALIRELTERFDRHLRDDHNGNKAN